MTYNIKPSSVSLYIFAHNNMRCNIGVICIYIHEGFDFKEVHV